MSKKTILSTVFAVAMMAIVGIGVNKSVNNDTALSDLVLANVEALANGEGNTPPTYNCPGGSKECVRVTRGNEVHIFYEQN